MLLPSQRPLRIAVVTETFPPEVNGVAHSIGRICAGLLARGVTLQIVRPLQPGETRPWRCAQAEHLLVSGTSLPNYPAVRFGLPAGGCLVRAWRANPPDAVHIVTEGPLGWSALRTAKRLGIAITSSFHTNFHGYAAHYGASWTAKAVMAYLRHFHNRAGVTIVPTAQMRDELAGRGISSLAVVGRGVDCGLFNPARRSEALRKSFGSSAESPVVLHVGRLAAEKNLAVLFAAFAAIHKHRRDARLVIVGDGPERARLQHAFPGHHFTGMLTGAPLAEHYASADLFLYPSLSETFGNVTLEAMASGLAVVAFDYAAAREHMRHMENGVLVPFGDAKSFVAMASMLTRSPHTIQMLREQARVKAESLDWDKVFDAFLGQVLATLSEHRRRRPPGNHAGAVMAV
jgi:glycosyltransferase involved in cell wall biosynthesis